ncbi:TRAP transporter small permease [Telmatospirillum sp. J64-1]|uniref:TRAP transporter small permease n=1 Tax=Telmatospirillum sp. J64-1 TaxID=2502183 RepID=UPI00115D1FB6|nr:TRAP transporter small permease [Telmatospirillum sp. J64-1]
MSEHDPVGRGGWEPERALAALILAAVCAISLVNVVVRYFTNYSFAATEEVSVALLVILALLGSVVPFVRRRHIAITVLRDRLPPLGRHLADAVAVLATLAMFSLVLWLGVRMAWDDYRFEVTSASLGLPQWIYTIALPVLAGLILLRVLVSVLWRRKP